jgi:hypothetical protein
LAKTNKSVPILFVSYADWWADPGTVIRGDMDGHGRFAVYFAMDIMGEGRGEAPLPPTDERGRMWKEWFQL